MNAQFRKSVAFLHTLNPRTEEKGLASCSSSLGHFIALNNLVYSL